MTSLVEGVVKKLRELGHLLLKLFAAFRLNLEDGDGLAEVVQALLKQLLKINEFSKRFWISTSPIINENRPWIVPIKNCSLNNILHKIVSMKLMKTWMANHITTCFDATAI